MIFSRVRIATQSRSFPLLAWDFMSSTTKCVQFSPTAGLGHPSKRFLSATPRSQIKEYFPPPRTKGVKQVNTHWVHLMLVEYPISHIALTDAHVRYIDKEMSDIRVAYREARNWSDWTALGAVRFFRWGMDLLTGYRHPDPNERLSARYKMIERDWLTRFIFLESVAGVPGMVGGMLRHLRSLRRMKRDNGWYVLYHHIIVQILRRYYIGLKHYSKNPLINECICSHS